jgi:hypothetical protein
MHGMVEHSSNRHSALGTPAPRNSPLAGAYIPSPALTEMAVALT